jgi:hypothetical protein
MSLPSDSVGSDITLTTPWALVEVMPVLSVPVTVPALRAGLALLAALVLLAPLDEVVPEPLLLPGACDSPATTPRGAMSTPARMQMLTIAAPAGLCVISIFLMKANLRGLTRRAN